MSLRCDDRLADMEEDEDALDNGGGIRSVEDPNLLKDRRVLQNVMLAAAETAERRRKEDKRVGEGEDTWRQPEIKPHMRKIVADWMLEVCEEQQCQPEVFPLAVDYLDRVLGKVAVGKSQFQLLACVCIFLASKFKESMPLCADKLVVYTDFSISVAEIMVSWSLIVNLEQWLIVAY